jgi:hypothetical protein
MPAEGAAVAAAAPAVRSLAMSRAPLAAATVEVKEAPAAVARDPVDSAAVAEEARASTR